MSCPDIDQLIDGVFSRPIDGLVACHLIECEECSNQVRLMRLLREIQQPYVYLPPSLIDRRVEAVLAILSSQDANCTDSRAVETRVSGNDGTSRT